MHLGYNQNVSYKGVVYHIQTEGGGPGNPVVTTQLFKGGVILATRRTSYSDTLKSEKLDVVVKEIMREQHSSISKDLLDGSLDDLLDA
jgi:hypothetical protein